MSNKFKIIHTSKKTGAETVIFDNTSDNIVENVGDLLTGVPITESVDDGMSTAVLHLKSCKGDVAVPALFEPYDKVEVQKSANSFMQSELYVVAIDNLQVDNSNLKTYEKTISLVEATKILDTVFIYNCNLTNSEETLANQIEKLLQNAEIIVNSKTNRFSISNELWNILSEFSSEDFFFDNVTLREAVYRILEVAHIRPYVNGLTYKNGDISLIFISYKSKVDYDEIKSLANVGTFIGEEAEVSIDNYFGTVKARGYNSISKNIMKIGISPFTTAETTLTSNNAIADLKFAIESVQSFQVGKNKLEITFKCLKLGVTRTVNVITDYWYEISSYIIPNELYQCLSEEEKKLKIPYTKGSSEIGMSKTYRTVLLTHSSFLEILNLDLEKKADSEIFKFCQKNTIKDTTGSTAYLDEVITEISINASFSNLYFKAEFIPRIDTVIEISKPGVYDNDRLKIAIADNQSANTIDIARHGRALAGLARRTGNEELTLNFICDGFNNLLPVMGKFAGLTGRDSYLNDYVITKREYAIYDDYLKVKYYCTKDYQAINEKIGVDREKRLYNIPLESSDCPIYVKYYVSLNLSKKSNDTEFSDTILFDVVKDLILNDYNDEKQFNYLYLSTPEAHIKQIVNGEFTTAQLIDNAYFAMPLLVYATDKSVIFSSQPLDNYSVGYSHSERYINFWGGGGVKMIYNPYTDSYGESTRFDIRLASKQGVENLLYAFPKVITGKSNYTPEKALSNEIQIEYYKDRTQRPVFFIAFEFLPSKELYGKVVFGEAAASQSFFVVSEAPEARYVYSSSEVYREGETRVKGTQLGGALNYFIPSLHDTERTVYLTVQKDMPLSSSIKAYAIGDESGNLLIAFNMALTKDTKLYFNISRKL